MFPNVRTLGFENAGERKLVLISALSCAVWEGSEFATRHGVGAYAARTKRNHCVPGVCRDLRDSIGISPVVHRRYHIRARLQAPNDGRLHFV